MEFTYEKIMDSRLKYWVGYKYIRESKTKINEK